MRDRSLRYPLTALAPAKINLFLHVVGRRPDGLHLLQSLFSFTDIGDRVSLYPHPSFAFEVRGPFASSLSSTHCAEENNLVVVAVKALQKFLRKPSSAARIVLEKNLPPSSGLGGGSSDAAATLKILQLHWGQELKSSDLLGLALTIGADVPACLMAESCFVSGIGEVILPLVHFPELPCVLVNPNVPLATANVFKTFVQREFTFTPPLTLSPQISEDLWGFLAKTKNDLQGAACGLLPDIGKVLMALEKTKGAKIVRMCGSGSTCFALFSSTQEANEAEAALCRNHSTWWVKSTVLRHQQPLLSDRFAHHL